MEVHSFGSPGPLESMMPSGLDAMISSAVVSAGYTVTSQPRLFRLRAMFLFAPRSRSATFGPFPSRTYFSVQVTFSTTLPVLYAAIFGRTSLKSSYSQVVIMPFMVPFFLSGSWSVLLYRSRQYQECRVFPEIPESFLHSGNCSALLESSRTMYPSGHGFADSISS